MIEKHYGKYIRNDADEQLSRLIKTETETLGGTSEVQSGTQQGQAAENKREKVGGANCTIREPFALYWSEVAMRRHDENHSPDQLNAFQNWIVTRN